MAKPAPKSMNSGTASELLGTYCYFHSTCSDQRRVVIRTQSLVERSFEVVQENTSLRDRCKKEIETLKNEKKRLVDRVKEIDGDLDEARVCS